MTAPPMYPDRVTIRDVGPRDGLQPEHPVAVQDRVRLVESLVAAGVAHIEVAAFVSPRAVPAMAGAAEVVAGLRLGEGVTRAALVPNVRGAQMALDAGVDELTVTISASEVYSRNNVKMSVGESLAEVARIVETTRQGPEAEVPVDAVVSCAFGSPYKEDITPAAVAELGLRLADAGVEAVTVADTTGVATPRQVNEVLSALEASRPTGLGGVGVHLHDTRGTALANAYAALLAGVTRFDTAVGGFGGSPFAQGAGGNLATEELVHLLDGLGVQSGIDLASLLEAVALIEELVGREGPSRVARHGPVSR